MGNKDGGKKRRVDNIPFDCTKSEYALQTLTAALPKLLFFQALWVLLKGVGMANSQTNKIHILKTTKYIGTSLRYARTQEVKQNTLNFLIRNQILCVLSSYRNVTLKNLFRFSF